MRWRITVLLALSVIVTAVTRGWIWYWTGLAVGPVLGPLDAGFYSALGPDLGMAVTTLTELALSLAIGYRVVALAVRIHTDPDVTAGRLIEASKWLIALSIYYPVALAIAVVGFLPDNQGDAPGWVAVCAGGVVSALAVFAAARLAEVHAAVPASIQS
jgi:hypothetical protein